jgi:hypothetical protein
MGAWTEIVDYTVPSNTSSFIVNNFGTITKNDFIHIVFTVSNLNATTNGVRLLANGVAGTNYTSQRLYSNGTSVSATRLSNQQFADTSVGATNRVNAYLKISENDRINIFSTDSRQLDASIRQRFEYSTSSGATFPNGITSFTLQNESGNIGAGSRIQIYRLDAQKVADITTTANATQVDISSLSIGKDSEYLLVSDLVTGASGASLSLTVNDVTALTSYNVQRIRGNGTTADAERENTARYTFTNSLVYSHIKLSEIGAYTSQNYELQEQGTSTLRLLNNFVSSTAENITSITKLNIVSPVTNAIGSGSRFILYKMK